MSKPLFTEEYIKSIAEALITAPVEEVIGFSTFLKNHPYGEELAEEVTQYLFGQFINELFALDESVEANEEKEAAGCSLTDVIKSQVTAKGLSEQIREQIGREELAESIRARFSDYTTKGEPANDFPQVVTFSFVAKEPETEEETQQESPVNVLASLIKEQVTTKNLSESIRSQIEEEKEFDEEEEEYLEAEIELDEVIEDILDEIIDDIIEQDAIPKNFTLSTEMIQYYQLAFEGAFLQKADERNLAHHAQYDAEYTSYILAELASYAVTFKGMSLTFQVVKGTVSPALV
ncbi:hypothetical protein AAAC51_06490 [Priestia megaterium]